MRARTPAADDRPPRGAVLGGHPAAHLARRRADRLWRRRPRLARRRPRAARRAGSSRPTVPSGSTTSASCSSVEHETSTHAGSRVVDVADPLPRRLVTVHDDLDALGDEDDAGRLARRRRGRLRLRPRGDLNRARDPRRRGRHRARARAHRHARGWPTSAPPGRRTAGRSPTSPNDPAAVRSTSSAPTAPATANSPTTRRTSPSPRGIPTAAASPRSGGGRNRFDLVLVDAASGAVERLAPGGAGHRRRGPRGRPRRGLRGPRDAAGAAPRRARRRRRTRAHAATRPAPISPRRPARAARRARGRDVPLLRRPRDPGLPVPPAERLAEDPVPAVVYPHGGPTDAYIDDRDAKAQYFIAKGYAWLAVELPRVDGLRARLRAPQPRRRGASTTRRTASPPRTTCAASTGSTGTGSRSSAGATARTWRPCAVTDDPEHRYRCAVAMYGDVDIVTSWAQGDRLGVQDLERMMGPPSAARAAYRAGSPVHRLDERPGPDPHRARRARRSREPRSSRRSTSPSCAGWARRSST